MPSAIARLDEYLEKHDSLQRRSLRARPIPPPPPPPQQPAQVPQPPPLTLQMLTEMETTLLKEHRYRMHRLKQVRATLNATLSMLESDDMAQSVEAREATEWDCGDNGEGDGEGGEESGGEIMDGGTSVSASLQKHWTDRRARATVLLAAFQAPPGAPAGHVQDKESSMSRLDISSAYITSLLGLD